MQNQETLCFQNPTMVSRRIDSTTAKGKPGKGWQLPKASPKPSRANPVRFQYSRNALYDQMCSDPSQLAIVTLIEVHHGLFPEALDSGMMDSGRETPNLGNGKIISPEPWAYGEINFLANFDSQLGDILNWFLQCRDRFQGLEHPGPWACWARSTIQLHHSSFPLVGEFHFAP